MWASLLPSTHGLHFLLTSSPSSQLTGAVNSSLNIRCNGRRNGGTFEDEMVGWHHRLDGHEFEWTPGVGDGQGGLVCCDPWGREELYTTERLN